MNILTAAEIRKVEEVEDKVGTDFTTLMEKAGTACAEHLMARFPATRTTYAIVVGKGKNGGDGFVIARKLKEQGYVADVYLAFGMPAADDAILNYNRAAECGVHVEEIYAHPIEAREAIRKADVVVDAIFGIGFRGAANSQQSDVFSMINETDGAVVAIDVPSGVITDTGAVEGACVEADYTYAISCYKPAHVFYPACEACGETEVLDIGITDEAFRSVNPTLRTHSFDDVLALLPIRGRTSHKNDFGHVLTVTGSLRMPGAASMCANAALRAGAGLLTAAFPQRAYPAVSSHVLEGMLLPLPDAPDGQLSVNALSPLHHAMQSATTMVIGCGLGQSSEVRAVVTDLLQNTRVPVVLDADGLNAVAGNPELLNNVQAEVVLTPHPGEMSRLMNVPVAEIQKDRVGAAASFADRYHCTVLLKGPDTVVASYRTDKIYVNTTGNQGLAKGGSGDTLSGILGALLAQHMDPFDAACCAAWLHGYAADYAAETVSYRGMTASDVLQALPFVLKEFE